MFFNFSELKLQEITVRQRSMLCMPSSSCPCGFCEPREASGLVPVSSECLWTSSWGGSVVFLDVLKAGFHLLLLFPTYKSISSGIYRFFLLLFWSIDNLRKPLKIKVLGGEDSIHSVLSEFLIVLKIHLNLDGKCMGQHNGYEHRLWNLGSNCLGSNLNSSCYHSHMTLGKSLKGPGPQFPNLKHCLIRVLVSIQWNELVFINSLE